MAALRFICFKQANFVRVNNESFRVEANRLMVFRDTTDVLISGEIIELTCSIQQLLNVCEKLCEQLPDNHSVQDKNRVRTIDFPESAQKMLAFSLSSDKCQAATFIIHYCLSNDWEYFSVLFSTMINEGGELIGFMKEYAFNPWPAERYASMLGISLRKFNMIFRERFGISPKRWLMETRLVHARYLLSNTMMSVADIASQCGFNNHAYFSESFRKRFSYSPSKWREHHLLNLNPI